MGRINKSKSNAANNINNFWTSVFTDLLTKSTGVGVNQLVAAHALHNPYSFKYLVPRKYALRVLHKQL